MVTVSGVWTKRADEAQRALEQHFWNDSIRMYNIETPCPDGACNTIFHYWWMAHAADVLVDGYLRTKDPVYAERLEQLYEGVLRRNEGEWPNELYDDMEWMALAWLRAYEATGQDKYKQAVLTLWEDIQHGWNDIQGGGIAWHKEQLGYKNTPANAPAVILAARLYRAFGNPADLEWAQRIYTWQKHSLVDPSTGFVWDGMNRIGDGAIDKDWKFTYCQGVFIGAAAEMHRTTGDSVYLADSLRTFQAMHAELADAVDGLLPDEGSGDAGLFKGILTRYVAEAIKLWPERADATGWLERNAGMLWEQGKAVDGALFGTDWRQQPGSITQLSSQLSGVMLLECAAMLEAWTKEADAGHGGTVDADMQRAVTLGKDHDSVHSEEIPATIWDARANRLQETMYRNYWNRDSGIMDQWFPREKAVAGENFYYWWQAHVLDVLIDAYNRTGKPEYASQMESFSRSLYKYNGNTFIHHYYDDMEWTALALLRAHQATGSLWYKEQALALWEDIKTAWNDHGGGGMAWKKDQLDYKNTPANAPAAILAARLYLLERNEEDLNWAKRVYEWNKSHLVDPKTGFVWDGMNRLGDGQIDYDWKFTYCQGVFLGAGVELYRCTGEMHYLEDAKRTAGACMMELCDPETLLLPDEGIDDTGLFKGILIRYLRLLLEEAPEEEAVRRMIQLNAQTYGREGSPGKQVYVAQLGTLCPCFLSSLAYS
ncbi:glycoside hydrolase family 76 protein [Paenibacillus sp. JCM 10914]|uniref:glycoside hydrolase family 76 protein n=1 Tax=Paenibacillus sp. JCM 10914 TaxID=1236974 RepID=UPI0003CC4648|nr:glycoside hydrolase family 76 protein [Paenibacillus sp. JCM 10914]GAE05978.1 putative alpha-1,6-mannanase [Paenibacillus sp. JCM 10914]